MILSAKLFYVGVYMWLCSSVEWQNMFGAILPWGFWQANGNLWTHWSTDRMCTALYNLTVCDRLTPGRLVMSCFILNCMKIITYLCGITPYVEVAHKGEFSAHLPLWDRLVNVFAYVTSLSTFECLNQSLWNSVAYVRKRTIPTERPPLVGEVSANFRG
jgi:hypothetical protein